MTLEMKKLPPSLPKITGRDVQPRFCLDLGTPAGVGVVVAVIVVLN